MKETTIGDNSQIIQPHPKQIAPDRQKRGPRCGRPMNADMRILGFG